LGPFLFDVVRVGDPTRHDVAAQVARVVESHGGEIAGMIVEPMLLGAGGMLVWSADQLRAVRDVTRQAGIPLIADEVLTGFGRTGPLFACEHAGVTPDVLCLSKGLTGGFLPLGATLTTERIFERFVSADRTHTLFHGHSYTANPIACAAALASIALLDGACADRRRSIEAAHRAAAPQLSAHRNVSDVRVLGTMLAFDIGPAQGYLADAARALRGFSLARGVLLRPLGNTVYMLPPYCSTAADLDRAYDVIYEFLDSR
jgi:adenosylmethionine-8-amino-7-oxononanoate aminotransferase